MSRGLFRTVLCAGVLVAFSGLASAAQIKGILMDKACSAKVAAGGQKVATGHDRACALMPACEKSGYGVVTPDNKFIAFDEAGNTKALAALKASKKKDDLAVTVNGDVTGDTVKVASLKLQ